MDTTGDPAASDLPDFELFGAAHVGVLLLVTLAAVMLVGLARRSPASRFVRTGERVLLAALLLTYPAKAALSLGGQGASWDYPLPMHLCDLAAYIAAAALVWRSQRLAELAYFWGLAGTLQGLITPAVQVGFPHPEFFRFFLLHASVVVASFYLPFGARLAPARGAVWRVFGWTQAYVLAAAAVNALTGANYGFLREPPPTASLIDVLGPWPWYLVALEGIALALFALLYLPFRWVAASPDRNVA